MKVTTKNIKLRFPFDKCCKLIFAVVPAEDLKGIREIRFADRYAHARTGKDVFGCYLRDKNGRTAVIEIHMSNILKGKIHEFTFTNYPEVAALLLSQVIFHQIGRHVHKFKREGVKKENREIFAAKYTAASYYRYLSSRKSKIFAEYRRASENTYEMSEEARDSARQSLDQIGVWLEANKEGVPFP